MKVAQKEWDKSFLNDKDFDSVLEFENKSI